MFNHIITKKNNQGELVLVRSKVKALFELSFYIVFFGVWYGNLIDDFSSISAVTESVMTKVSEQKFLVIFFLAPLVSVKRIWLGLSTITIGNKYSFRRVRQRILHNQKEICRYDQIKNIRIRRIYDSEGSDSYRLYIVYSESKKFFIAESTDSSYINGLASNIADECNRKIEYKD